MAAPVLIVEDDILQLQMLSVLLERRLGYGAQTASNGREALDILEADGGRTIRLVIMDLNMPVMGGMETLGLLRQRYPALPVIMLTGSKDINDAIDAMKLGATDFVVKPYEGERMMVTIGNALKIGTLSREVSRLRGEIEGRASFNDLIGHDGGLAKVVDIARKASASDIPVLLTGETGVGKEVFARAIHGESSRCGAPFIAVNCGAIPSQLVESTLFGHQKGAFTGATDKATGKFREAEGGTIFLDEVGELPLEAQVKLLRVLQQKEVEPVGASKPVPVNVRIISATNRDLLEEVKAGRFREDLYFRLNVLQIGLPALRERREDILPLARHFIERHCGASGNVLRDLSPAAQALLQSREWPGNVRELENAINRAMVLSEGNVLHPDDFAGGGMAKVHDAALSASANDSSYVVSLLDAGGRFKTMEEIEHEVLESALICFDQNITQASKALGIAKSTFYRKMEEADNKT